MGSLQRGQKITVNQKGMAGKHKNTGLKFCAKRDLTNGVKHATNCIFSRVNGRKLQRLEIRSSGSGKRRTLFGIKRKTKPPQFILEALFVNDEKQNRFAQNCNDLC